MTFLKTQNLRRAFMRAQSEGTFFIAREWVLMKSKNNSWIGWVPAIGSFYSIDDNQAAVASMSMDEEGQPWAIS